MLIQLKLILFIMLSCFVAQASDSNFEAFVEQLKDVQSLAEMKEWLRSTPKNLTMSYEGKVIPAPVVAVSAMYATRLGSLEPLKIALDRGFDPNAGVPFSGTEFPPLAMTLQGFDTWRLTKEQKSMLLEATELLLENGANPNKKNSTGETSLHFLVHSPEPEVVKTLLDKGVSPNIQNSMGRTPLHFFSFGAKKIDPETAKALLSAGANPRLADKDGKTPLHFLPNPEIAKILVNGGADVNHMDQDGNNALHSAVERGNLEMVEFLLNAGVDPNIRNSKNGNTPLHLNISSWDGNEQKIIQLLIDAGADPNIKNNDGHSAIGDMNFNLYENPSRIPAPDNCEYEKDSVSKTELTTCKSQQICSADISCSFKVGEGEDQVTISRKFTSVVCLTRSPGGCPSALNCLLDESVKALEQDDDVENWKADGRRERRDQNRANQKGVR